MMPIDVSVTMIVASLRMRALGEWLLANHEKLDPATIIFLDWYMTEIARRATITAVTVNQALADRRCIFY